MHMKPMADSEGKFSKKYPVPEVKCRKCEEKGKVSYETWESSCGGFEDYKYTCGGCGHYWWIDGPDS